MPDHSRGFRCRIRVTLPAVFTILASLLIITASWSATDYKLGPDDEILITVLRHEDFSGKYVIPSDGIIDIPTIGQVQASGKTMGDLQLDLVKLFRKRLLDPEVSISLIQPRIQRVYVLGVVDKPGMFDCRPGWRITEAVAAAGGVAKEARISECSAMLLKASTGEKKNVSLAGALDASSEENLPVEPGDVVVIQSPEKFFASILGQVEKPGVQELSKGSDSISDIISMAGGIKDKAATSRVVLTHANGSSETVNISGMLLKGSKAAIKLGPGDVVVVPETTSTVAVLGWVVQPGYYPIPEGRPLSMSEAIALAKGPVMGTANVGKVVLVRDSNGKVQKSTVDLSKYYKTGDMKYNPIMQEGDTVYLAKDRSFNINGITQALTALVIFRDL